MADQVTIKPETNKVELTDQRRQISVTDNRTGTSINLTQTDPQVIQINTPGPQGASGITTSGSFSGSFQGDGSGLTGVVASGSIDSASFAITASFAETASYAISASHEIIKEVSSSFADTASFAQNGDGIFSGSFSGSFEGDGSNLTGVATSTGSFTGSLTGSMLVSDHILPDTDEIYDLGSSEKKFRDLYLSGSSIYLGDKKVTIDDGTLKVFDSGTLDPAPAQLSGSFTGSFSGSFVGIDGFTLSNPEGGANQILTTTTSSATASSDANLTFDGDVLNVLGNVYVQGTLDAATKNFKINHPTMPGYYLVHSSLEGPERGIYHRGKLKTSNTIFLPDYWKDLPVDDVDITVQLTPIGNACQHFVKSITKEKIEIECECGKPHCFYIVHAQRYDQGKFEILEPKQIKTL